MIESGEAQGVMGVAGWWWKRPVLNPVHGFVGASRMERLPVEKGIREMTAASAAIRLRKK